MNKETIEEAGYNNAYKVGCEYSFFGGRAEDWHEALIIVEVPKDENKRRLYNDNLRRQSMLLGLNSIPGELKPASDKREGKIITPDGCVISYRMIGPNAKHFVPAICLIESAVEAHGLDTDLELV